MKLNTKILLDALKELGTTVEKKDFSQITSYIFFEAVAGGVNITSCDEITTTQVFMKCSDAITFNINFVSIFDFLKMIDTEFIDISLDGYIVKVKTTLSDASFEQYDLDFSDLDYFDTEISDAVSCNNTIDISESIFCAIDRTNPKLELNGMLVDFRNGKILSSDTKRLAIMSINKQDVDSIIIHKKSLSKNILITDLKVNRECATFKQNGIIKKARLIIGEFPNYERIIPKDRGLEIRFNGIELKKKISKYKDCKISFLDNIATVTDTDKNISFKIKCDYPSSNEIFLGVSAKYLRESIVTNEVKIILYESNNLPFVVENIYSCEKINKTVIMPIATDFCNLKVTFDTKRDFEFNDLSAKKTIKRVNKDKIILELNNEIVLLKERLAKYEDEKSIVANEVFKSIVNKSKRGL